MQQLPIDGTIPWPVTSAVGGAPSPGGDDAGDATDLRCEEVWGGNRRADRRVGLPGLTAWVFSQPCHQTTAGGDVHYVSACAGWRLVRLLVADVAGHGPDAAGTADALCGLMRRMVGDADQRRLVRQLNRAFAEVASEAEPGSPRFATAVVLTYDSLTGRLLACNAGHPPPLWYRAATRRWTMLESAGAVGRNFPVGILGEADYDQLELALGAGDLVLCYTDALIEARDGADRQLGTGGLLDLVRRLGDVGPGRLVSTVVAELGRLNPRNLAQDDLTCLLVKVTAPEPIRPVS